MNAFLKRLKDAAYDAALRAYVKVQIFAAQEPVRLRAGILALILAGALHVGVDVSGWAEYAATLGAVVLPIIVGESARKRVSPTYDQ